MKEACYFHSEMVGKGFSLRTSSYNALIKGLLKKKRVIEARQLFEQMRTEGLVADQDIYSIFLDLNYNEGDMEMTLELCDETIEKCLVGKTHNEHK
ncbi:Pentatricopeptide repeat-containing protein mitochondrial [Thalictrum thalictroides]|uniref:Pentatricopeptide repeat-containing protein mitochondrial n=1 Tax=Thalictrum thalictroides TaxID=46969 RepID=A0A7J6WB33_THATH|nr:Pentatricopeptide repeat-containing protein mitochondrial [Thalictrum thalictroides]